MRRHGLREMVPGWLDAVLYEWSRWMLAEDTVTRGYPRSSAGFGDSGSLKSWDDLEDGVIGWQIRVCDSIIDGLPCHQRMALANVYIADVYRSPRWDMAAEFHRAVEAVTVEARQRGVM